MENDKMFDLLEKIYIEVQDTKKEVKDTKKEVQSHGKKIDNIEKTISKIEVEHGQKLEALFDGYKQNTESLEVIDEKLDKLQIDVNNLSMKTANNDTRIIELSRKLKKVK